MIEDTCSYTERLSNIMESLEILDLSELLPQSCFGNKDRIDERGCLKKCLKTCVRISESINERPGLRLGGYHEKLTATISELREFLQAIDRQNVVANPWELRQSVQPDQSIPRYPEHVGEQELGSENVNMNRFEDIYVAEDGNQIITSAASDLIQAKNISAAVRSVQCLGQLSGTSLRGILGAVTQPR